MFGVSEHNVVLNRYCFQLWKFRNKFSAKSWPTPPKTNENVPWKKKCGWKMRLPFSIGWSLASSRESLPGLDAKNQHLPGFGLDFSASKGAFPKRSSSAYQVMFPSLSCRAASQTCQSQVGVINLWNCGLKNAILKSTTKEKMMSSPKLLKLLL